MKNALKKAISILLVAVMLFGAAPLAGFVGLELPRLNLFAVNANAEESATSGTCGENLTWTFDNATGELVISGEGYMNNWSFNDNSPWYSKRNLIKSVTICDGVKSIGAYAFLWCKNTSTLISESVISIGDSAFKYCDSLTSIKIPDGVKNLGDYSFNGCKSLETVTISRSVIAIGKHAFDGCDNLNTIRVDDANDYFSSDENGVLFNKNESELIQYPIGNTRTSYKVPDSVKSISHSAFAYCMNLANITICENVTSIGDYAFYCCKNLTSISLPESISKIGACVFSDCVNLATIIIPDSITSIGDMAFGDCDSLTSIIIPDRVTSIGKHGFYSCDNLSNVSMGNDVIYIGDWAFEDCNNLESITLGNRVTSIGYQAFYGCKTLKTLYSGTPEQWAKITVESGNSALTSNVIFECESERPYYGMGSCGNNLTWILDDEGELEITGKGAMSYGSWQKLRFKIKTVTIGNGVTTICNNAFRDCDNITSITIPQSVMNIDYEAFEDCNNLKNVEITNGVTRIGGAAFSACSSLESITIPESVTTIESDSFSNCESLEKVVIRGTSVNISEYAFTDSSKTILYCKSASNVQEYAKQNDMMCILLDGPTAYFAIEYNEIISYKGNETKPTIPWGIKSIGENAFKNNEMIVTLELPASVTSISTGAFSNCSALKEIFIPNTVRYIAADSFNDTNAKIICYDNSIAHQFAIYNGIEYELVKITLNVTDVIIKVGESYIITATPEQEHIELIEVNWKSSNTSIATVDEKGNVTAKRYGNVIVYAVAPSGTILATCSINVVPDEAISADVVKRPTQTTINYGDTIVLSVDESMVPVGGRVEWIASNNNFSYKVSGTSCVIHSEKSGDTTFAATIYDAYGNDLLIDTQTMTSKAGFFDKIIAFFKKLFGLTKTIPEAVKVIY